MKFYCMSFAATVLLFGCSESPPVDTTKKDEPKKVEIPVEADPVVEDKPLGSGIILEHIDTSVKPGDDFFKYANGKWLDTVEIPEDKASLGSFQILHDEAQENVMAIIKNSAEGDFKKGSNEQKVGDLYNAYTNMEARDKAGIEPLVPELEKIDAIQNQEQLARYFAYAIKHSLGTPFALAQFVDFKNPESYMIYSWQAGLALPDREYYTSDEGSYQEIREKYQKHVAKMLTLTGIENPEKSAEIILDLETELASYHMKKEKTRDMVALYNKVPVAELSELMPKFNWTALLQELELTGLDGVVVTQMDYMRNLDDVIADTPLDAWKIYLKWMAIHQGATLLTTELDNANFEFFSKVLYGVEEQRPRWRRGVNLVNQHLGEVIGEVYVKEHFPPAAKERMLELVDNLLKAYEISIKELTWMSDETKKEALDKLSKFTPKIGYPDKWKDYSQLNISESDLIGNIKRSNELQWQQVLEKQPGPVQKHEWNMTPQTVNAYYNPPANEIVFPAGILQPPFFNMEAENAVNYGGIGAVIGHEIGHGFDDAGSTFDGDGVLRNWWTEKDKEEFKKRTQQLVDQYNKFQPLEDLNVNGEFTLGENIGDLGGISIALKAYELALDGKEAPVLDGYTARQRIFLGYAQVWATVMRDETLRNQISTDPHSPAEYRVNGALPNVPEFYQAFDVKEGDAMYLAPEDRVKIW